MRLKCKISTHRQSNNSLHVQIDGTLDDSAMAFMCSDIDDELKKSRRQLDNLWFHTEKIEKISLSDMGRGVFEKNLINFSNSASRIQFTGSGGMQLRNGAVTP